jgi:hypothetical protein
MTQLPKDRKPQENEAGMPTSEDPKRMAERGCDSIDSSGNPSDPEF